MVPITLDGEGDLNIDYFTRVNNSLEDFNLTNLGLCEEYPSECVFFKLPVEIMGWTWNPTPITEEDFTNANKSGNPWPEDFHDHWKAQVDKQQIWVDCQGRDAADKEALALAGMEYYPASRGFDANFFRYETNKTLYDPPLVAVRFTNLTVGQPVHMECRTYYHRARTGYARVCGSSECGGCEYAKYIKMETTLTVTLSE